MAHDGTLKFDTKILTEGFQAGISKIGGIAEKGLKATGAILTGAATAVGALGAAAIKVGSDFETAMSKVEAISGATGGELEALQSKAKEMGATTKFSATESANAFEYMAMAGWKTEDMLNGIEGIMNLAAASGEDLATTSDIVTDALTAFGLSASDSTHFADVLAKASSNANTNVGMMGETFKYVAPVAGALGYSAEDTAIAIGLMANSGIKASQAGTALRSIMSRMAKPTDEVQAAMDALGVSLTDDNGKMKSLNEIMGDLRNGFSDLSEAEAANMAAALGGQEAMSGLLAIVNASDEDFSKLESAIYTCDGAAAQMAETMNDNLQGQLTILKSGLEGLGISLYENMQEPLKGIAKEAQGMVAQLQEAFDKGGLEGMVSAFGDVLAQLVERIAGAAPELINAAAGLVGSFCDSLKSSQGIGDAAGSLVTTLVTALFNCAGDIWTTAIVLAGKLAEGIAAGAPQMVQAASDCITNISDTLITWLPSIVDSGTQIAQALVTGMVEMVPANIDVGIQVVQALVTGISSMLPTLMSQAVTLITTIATKLVENLPMIVGCVLQIVQGLIDGLLAATPLLLDGAVQLFQAIVDAVPVIIERLLTALPDIITSIFDFLVASIPQIVDAAVQMLNGIVEAIPTIIQAIITNLPQIIQALVSGLVKAVPKLLQAAITLFMSLVKAIPKVIVSIVKSIPDIIMAIIDGLLSFASGLLELGGQLLGFIWDGIKKGWSSLVEWVTVTVPQLIGQIGTFFAELPGKIWEWLVQTVTKIAEWGLNMQAKAKEGISNMIAKVWTTIQELPGKIWDGIVGAVTKISEWGMSMQARAKESISNMVSKVVTTVKELPGKIWDGIVGAFTKISEWGMSMQAKAKEGISNMVSKVFNTVKELPGKIWNGIVGAVTKISEWGMSMQAKAKEAIGNVVSKVVDGFKALPDKIKSIGKNLVEGLWNGINNAKDWVIDKIKGFGDAILGGLKSFFGIHSPSKVFEKEIGIWLLPGVVNGMEDTLPKMLDEINTDMDALVDQVQTDIPVMAGNFEFDADDSLQSFGDAYRAEMELLSAKMGMAVSIETGKVIARSKASADHTAAIETAGNRGDTYIDNHVEQENNYHVPVASPSETSRAQREAARKLLGGVK